MYTVTDTCTTQGKTIFKILSLETGEKITLTVAKEFLPPFVKGEAKGRKLYEEEFEALYETDRVTDAAYKALNALSYGNMSRRALILKLTSKYKIEKEYAEAAADYAVRHRYIDEASQALRIAEQCVRVKKQGKRKIAAYLISKGYEKDAVTSAINAVPDCDYENAAYFALLKKTDCMPETKEEKYKLASTLIRQGHSKSHIEKAFSRLRDGE